MTARGRVLVVLAFVVAAALCGGAAVALVKANKTNSTPEVLPSIHPTLLLPSTSPTPSPSTAPTPVFTVTPVPTTAARPTPSPSAKPATTTSPAPRRTPTPKATRTTPSNEGLSATASLNIGSGGTTKDTYVLTVHATDGNGKIYLRSVDWGDPGGATTLNARGAACNPPASAPADCRNYAVSHKYAAAGTYIITVDLVSGSETSTLHLTVTVDSAPS